MMNQQQGSQESFNQSTNDGEQGWEQISGRDQPVLPLQPPSPWQIQGKGGTYEGPKSEHPSTYDESVPPLSYRAQDYRQASSSSSPNNEASAGVGGSPRVGAGAKVGGGPRVRFSSTSTVPPWARPQQNNVGNLWIFGALIAAIMLFPVSCFIIKLLISFIPLIVFIALVVPIMLGVLLLAFVIIAIFWIIAKIHSIFWW